MCNIELGYAGEQLAVDYLEKNNYQILERNWRYQKAEIDIIAQKEDTIISVEVKTRASNYFGNPQDFVNRKKIELSVLALDRYVTSKRLDADVQFDIIAIIKNKHLQKINHIEDAFLYF